MDPRIRHAVTTALDVLALLLIAAGVALALRPLIGLGLALIVSGVVLAVGSLFGDREAA